MDRQTDEWAGGRVGRQAGRTLSKRQPMLHYFLKYTERCIMVSSTPGCCKQSCQLPTPRNPRTTRPIHSHASPHINGCPHASPSIIGCPHASTSIHGCPYASLSINRFPHPKPSINGCPHPKPSINGCPYASPSINGCPHALPTIHGCPHALPSINGCPHALPSINGCPHALQSIDGCPHALPSIDGCPRCKHLKQQRHNGHSSDNVIRLLLANHRPVLPHGTAVGSSEAKQRALWREGR